jgi:hypothetical protein
MVSRNSEFGEQARQENCPLGSSHNSVGLINPVPDLQIKNLKRVD